MAGRFRAPRKQRTRAHIIADLGVHHVEGFILEAGHTAQRFERDYGYDLCLKTYDQHGYVEPGFVLLQVKAAEELRRVGSQVVFDIEIRDYNLWMSEDAPVILILYDVAAKRAYWQPIQHYFRQIAAHRPQKNVRSVRVRIPTEQLLDAAAIETMRRLKRRLVLQR